VQSTKISRFTELSAIKTQTLTEVIGSHCEFEVVGAETRLC